MQQFYNTTQQAHMTNLHTLDFDFSPLLRSSNIEFNW